MKLDLYSQSGEKKGQIEVSDAIFNAPVKDEVIRLALIRQQGNERQAVAHTKTRGEISLSTRKLYRQKGTGRARMGGANNPVRRGGGVTFGPRSDRNFTKRMPLKERRVALFSLLSQKAAGQDVLALEGYVADKPKTQDLDKLLKKLTIRSSALIVLDKKNRTIEKSADNLSGVKTILVSYLNPFDLLKYKKVLFLADALKKTEKIFL